jgi:hypothetical protein
VCVCVPGRVLGFEDLSKINMATALPELPAERQVDRQYNRVIQEQDHRAKSRGRKHNRKGKVCRQTQSLLSAF